MDTTAIAAWWGAVVATVVLLWDIYKWKYDGPRLLMRVFPNRKVINNPVREGKTWVSVVISNVGTRPTTLKVIGVYRYKSLVDRIRGNTAKEWVIPNPSDTSPLPHILKPGEEWTGYIPQKRDDINLEEMAKNNHLIIWASLSHTSKEKKVRLFFKPKPE